MGFKFNMLTIDNYRNYFYNFITCFGIYILWIFIHYFAANLYTKLCTPFTFIGFISSPFLATTPHCQAIRWVVYNGGNSILVMWGLLAAWIMRYLIPLK
jgi:hypothetical protein